MAYHWSASEKGVRPSKVKNIRREIMKIYKVTGGKRLHGKM